MDSLGLFFHIVQGCFTGTGESYECPSFSEVNLKDMGKTGQYKKHYKPQKGANLIHISWDLLFT